MSGTIEGLRPRMPRVTEDFPPPATVTRLVCPRCETFARLTDRTIRANYADPNSIVFCVSCFDGTGGDVVHLEIERVRPIAEEFAELRADLAKLDRLQSTLADHEAMIVFKRRAGIRAELGALEQYAQELAEERRAAEDYLASRGRGS